MRKFLLPGALVALVAVLAIGRRDVVVRSQPTAAEQPQLPSKRPIAESPVDPDLTGALDPTLVRAGEKLFRHEWTQHDALSPGGDGLGPVYNATSCVACHFQNGIGGSGDLAHNVTTFLKAPGYRESYPRSFQGIVHSQSTFGRLEALHDIHRDLPKLAQPSLGFLLPPSAPARLRCGITLPIAQPPFNALVTSLVLSEGGRIVLSPDVQLSQRNTIALFGVRLIDALPEAEILANERRQQQNRERSGSADAPAGRAVQVADGKVGRFGWKAQSASLADFVRLACANEIGLGNPGHEQSLPIYCPTWRPCSTDLTNEQCNQITIFVASLPRPEERVPADSQVAGDALAGKKLFQSVGCAACHVPDVGRVTGLYSDLLVHDMGNELQGSGSYFVSSQSPTPREWRTPPLWGVADSAPYLHDGRAATLEEAIALHAGEGSHAAKGFRSLRPAAQHQLVAFLRTLRAPAAR